MLRAWARQTQHMCDTLFPVDGRVVVTFRATDVAPALLIWAAVRKASTVSFWENVSSDSFGVYARCGSQVVPRVSVLATAPARGVYYNSCCVFHVGAALSSVGATAFLMTAAVIECFILVPAPHEPVFVRLDRRATIRHVKSALECKRGWPCESQKLRLENGHVTSDSQSLVSLRLHKQAFPTLQLQLSDPSSKRARTGAGASEVQVEPDGDERAALDIQRITRGKHARRQYEDGCLWLAVRAVCANTEVRSAVRIQRQWRQLRAAMHAARRVREVEAAGAIQQVHRNRKQLRVAMHAARRVREVEAAGAIQRVHRNRQRRLSPKRNQAAWLREMIAEAEAEAEEPSDRSADRDSSGLLSPLAEEREGSGPDASPADLTVALRADDMLTNQAQPTRTATAPPSPPTPPTPLISGASQAR